MKKYYAYFIYDGMEFVIRFKVDGSLHYDRRYNAFIDRNYYVRSVPEIVCLAAIDKHYSINDKYFSGACFMLTHDEFINFRKKGYQRWMPMHEKILWD